MAIALLALTLNFLQPLTHAAMLRGAASQGWLDAVFCGTAPGRDNDGKSSIPATKKHECLAGLTSTAKLLVPAAAPCPPQRQELVVNFVSAPSPGASAGRPERPQQARAPPLPA